MLNFTFIRALPSSVPSFHAGWTDDLYQDDYDGSKNAGERCAGRGPTAYFEHESKIV